ncbi:MAG TPA: hypothetical protein VGN12_06445, partial [Pirellulales bacterium]
WTWWQGSLKTGKTESDGAQAGSSGLTGIRGDRETQPVFCLNAPLRMAAGAVRAGAPYTEQGLDPFARKKLTHSLYLLDCSVCIKT